MTRNAADSALRAKETEMPAEYQAHAAVRDALAGNAVFAKQEAEAALKLSNGKRVASFAAIALALAGDSARAMELAADVAKRFPEDTVVQIEYLPMIHAAVALRNGDASRAVSALQAATPYEMGELNDAFTFGMYPVYLRGEAYLAARQGSAAVGEFQKIVDHAGVAGNQPIGALAHLGLGRAYVGSGDTANAKKAYQEFFTLWGSADGDVPILREAKAEFAKLQ